MEEELLLSDWDKNEPPEKKVDSETTQRGRPCLLFFNFWVKFSIQNVVLKVARRKISNFFACNTLFSCVFDESVYRSALIPQNLNCFEKLLVAHLNIVQ